MMENYHVRFLGGEKPVKAYLFGGLNLGTEDINNYVIKSDTTWSEYCALVTTGPTLLNFSLIINHKFKKDNWATTKLIIIRNSSSCPLLEP